MKVFKRGNIWWFSGVVDGISKRFTLGPTIKSKEEAMAWLSNFQQIQNELSLRCFITAYLKERRFHLSEDTFASYKASLFVFESYFGVHRKIDTITAREINSWVGFKLNEGLKPVTVNVHLRNIKAAFNRAVTWELIVKAPKFELVKMPNYLPRHLTKAEFNTLLSNENNPDLKRLWIFMVYTGVRRAEALGLRWHDINLCDKPQALITGKGDKQRMIPLLAPAVEALGVPGEGLVFPCGHADYLSHRFAKTAKSAGLKAKLHDLRHTALNLDGSLWGAH